MNQHWTKNKNRGLTKTYHKNIRKIKLSIAAISKSVGHDGKKIRLICGGAKVKEWDFSSHTWREKKKIERFFPGQGLFTVIGIKGLGLMGKNVSPSGQLPLSSPPSPHFFFFDKFSMACHGCTHDYSRAEAVLGIEGKACYCLRFAQCPH